MSGKDRQLFLVPISVAGWLGGTIIIGAIAAYVMYLSPSFEQAFAGAFIVVILLIPLLFWFGYRGLQIMRSVRRFSDSGSVRTR
jgi:FtsH-binding integral membrane protein